MIRVLHTADLHLDSPFSLLSQAEAQKRRRMLRGTFTSATLYARTENIDLFLISGDVFDDEYVTRDTMDILCEQCEKNPSVRFVIAPGNHDPYTENSPWAKTELPSNVYVFNSPFIRKFSFDDINTDVYGWAFTSESMDICPLFSPLALDPGRINILCAHADVVSGGKSDYCPLSIDTLSASGFDYAALGHIHKASDGIQKAGGTYYAYPGCLEGRSFDECGKKSAIVAEFDKSGGIFSPRFRARPFTDRRFERLDVDVSGAQSAPDVIAAAEAAIKAACFDASVSVRLTLKGRVEPQLIISKSTVTENLTGPSYIELRDETLPTLDIGQLCELYGIRGEFCRCLMPLLESDSGEERARAALALKYGLDALGQTLRGK